MNDSKLGRFYLFPKIYKRLHNVPGRPVISNSSYFTDDISSFLDFYLKPLAQKVKSYIQDTNDFLKKIANLPFLLDNIILCTTDIVGLYPNIPLEEGVIAIRRALDTREDKTISADSLIELAECVLKNSIFEHDKGTLGIGTKMALPYAITFMDSIEEDILSKSLLKPLFWWRYIDDIFMMWEHGEKSFKIF